MNLENLSLIYKSPLFVTLALGTVPNLVTNRNTTGMGAESSEWERSDTFLSSFDLSEQNCMSVCNLEVIVSMIAPSQKT